jgi:Fe-S-cluster containining protein
MELYGRQQHLYYINQELADRVKDLVAATFSGGRNEAAVLALASHAFSLADHLIDYFESHNQLPHPIACREGCNFCCFNQVEVTPPEALLIGHHVAQNFSPDEKDALMNRVTRSLTFKAGKSKKKIARLRHQLPCPLLQGGSCSVYGVRPLVCRAMHAFTPGSCEAELLQGKLGPGEFYAHRYEFIWSISSGLQTGCRELGCQTGVLDLDLALRDVLTQENPAERWIAGENIFGP